MLSPLLAEGPFVNDLFVSLGIESWKAVLTALLLPPVPLLLLTLFGARLILWRRGLGWLLLLLSVAGLWLTACSASGEWLMRHALAPPPPLPVERMLELKRGVTAGSANVAVVVLGGGREALAPEYGVASLAPGALERLRFGVWLGREIGAPIMFSAGLGHQSVQTGATEAEVAEQIAAKEFLRPLTWTESQSRDTRENALFSTQMLRKQGGVQKLVLVTHGWHMPRALRAFTLEAQRQQAGWEIVPAPMGLAAQVERPVLRWIPSSEGYLLMRAVWREKLGWWLGA
jgi:uncharacterized SAM-binding protein YcdF (DUF218 family)